jgi:hypothetical protein
MNFNDLPPGPFDPSVWSNRNLAVLGIAGYAGVGKDTIARVIGWSRTAFADVLKEDVREIIRDKMGIDILHCTSEEKNLARPVMVEWGRLGRAIDPDYWLKRLQLPARAKFEKRVVISDTRYANEAQAIFDAGGTVIYLWREEIGPANEEEADSIAALLERFGDRVLKVHNVLNEHIMAGVHADCLVRKHFGDRLLAA